MNPKNLLDRADADLRLKIAIEHAVRRNLQLPPEIRAQVFGGLAGERGLTTYDTFREFVQARNPSLLQFDHVHYVIPAIEKICTGELTRALVLWPTQYLKSELFSRLLPAYYLLKHPSRWVGLASYNAELSWELSAEARDHYAGAGGHFKDGGLRAAAKNWRTKRLTQGSLNGGMWATSIDGRALGKGFHLGIVDDPIDPKQVTSRAYQRRFANWWPSKWLRALRPSGCLVFVMQRLGVDDPIAWLLEREQEAIDNGDLHAAHRWHVLAYDEIKSDEPFAEYKGPRGFPTTCTVEVDPRKRGDVLSPSWKSPAWVKATQAQAGAVVAAAQRQQRPMLPTGDFWKLKAFEGREVDELPANAYDLGWDWDLAYTKKEENSASAGVRSARGPGKDNEFTIYIVDVDFDWLEFPGLITFIKEKAAPHYVEQKASGKSAVQTLKTYSIPAFEVPVNGDKLARASAVQPAVDSGRVYVVKRVKQKLLYAQSQGLLRVTVEQLVEDGEGLDLNDAFVQALWRHLKIGAKTFPGAFR